MNIKIPLFDENQDLILQNSEKEKDAHTELLPRLLIVDDEWISINVLANLFKYDYDIFFAKNGYDALEIAQRSQPDLILLDIVMPEITGYEVCKQLKLDPCTSGIPIIFISAVEGNGESEVYGLELGAIDYIHKPFNLDVVKKRVGNHIKIKRSYDVEKESWKSCTEQFIIDKEKAEIQLENSTKQNDLLYLQVKHMQKLDSIGQMTAGIAHDFNNILSCMLGYNELNLLISEDIDTDIVSESKIEFEQNVKKIDEAGQRAVALIRKMMSYCRQHDVNENIEVKPTTEVIDEVLIMLQPALTKKIKLQVAFECNEIIQIDSMDLHQILTNLAVNARDAMKEYGGTITISLKIAKDVKAFCISCAEAIEGEFIELSVADSGTGIPPEIISQIFAPFFTTKVNGEGTGLGLFAVSEIVHRSKGHVLIDSKLDELNHGTIFRLLFPIFAKV